MCLHVLKKTWQQSIYLSTNRTCQFEDVQSNIQERLQKREKTKITKIILFILRVEKNNRKASLLQNNSFQVTYKMADWFFCSLTNQDKSCNYIENVQYTLNWKKMPDTRAYKKNRRLVISSFFLSQLYRNEKNKTIKVIQATESDHLSLFLYRGNRLVIVIFFI